MRQIFIFLLMFMSFSFAKGKCYFMERIPSIEKSSKIVEVSCEKATLASTDMDYFKKVFNKEGNLIIDGDQLVITQVFDSFYSSGEHGYNIYMSGVFFGANPISCYTTTSEGPNCGPLEFVLFGIILRDFYLYQAKHN